MKVVTDTMMGKCYPFFLNNNSVLSKSPYYLYEIYSPCINEKLNPMFSLRKLSEKVLDVNNDGTSQYPIGNDSDIINFVSNTKRVKKTSLEYLKSIYRNEDIQIIVDSENKKFPFTEINLEDTYNSLQKQVIINLRDSLRWKTYKFFQGRQVDLLYSPTEFVVYEFILEDKENIKLIPKSVYKNTDIEMKNPIRTNLANIAVPKINLWNKEKFGEINVALKLFEWESFSRREIISTKKKR